MDDLFSESPYQQSKYAKAEKLYQDVLAFREGTLGRDHSDTVQIREKLAGCYYKQGKYANAELLYQKVLASRERTSGDTVQIREKLGDCYYKQNKYAEAELLYQKVLASRERTSGDTVQIREKLGDCYYSQGEYTEAGSLYQKVLTFREQKLGSDHSDTVRVRKWLAHCYYNQGKYAEAEELYRKVLHIQEEKLGPDCQDTVRIRACLAECYYKQSKYAKAEPLYQVVLTFREEKLGSDHSDTTRIYDRLTYLHYKMQGGSTDPASLVISPKSVDRLNKPFDEPASSECRLPPSPLKRKTTKIPLREDKNYFEERYPATLLPGKSKVHIPSIRDLCATCATQMLLHDQGINDISDQEVAQELDHVDGEGAYPCKIPRVLRRSAIPYRWMQNLTIEDLREALKSGYSISASIKRPKGELKYHAVVVDKVGKKNVYIRDSRHEEPYKVSIDAWKLAWNKGQAAVPMLYLPRELKGNTSEYEKEINKYKNDKEVVSNRIR